MGLARHDWVALRELGRQDVEAGTREHRPEVALHRVAWAAPRNDAELDEAVVAARADGASWQELADAIGTATPEALEAEYGGR